MTAPASRRLRASSLVLAFAPFVWLVARFDFVCDDAYISFRYARNFAEGLGLVYNPGVDPPVEGYSEFLWVVLMGAVEALDFDPAVASRVVSIASGAALLVLVQRLIQRRLEQRTAAVLGASFFLGTLPPLAVWASGGMATLPFALAVFLCFERLFGNPERPCAPGASVAAVLLVLLRADGAFWVAAVVGSALVVGIATGRRALARAALIAAGVSVLVFAIHIGWRYATYGDWLPNTARVKLGLSSLALARGWDYLAHFLLTFPTIALAALLPLVSPRRCRGQGLLPAATVALATCAYALVVGGDFMCFGRFFVPALPFVCLLFAAGLGALEERWGRLAVGATVALCSTLSLLPAFDRAATPESLRQRFQFRWNAPTFLSEYGQWARMDAQAREWEDLGRAIHRHTEPGDSIVHGAVGAVGYFSERFVYDRNGLVTREVALRDPRPGRNSPGHDKTVPKEYFLQHAPTYIDVFLWPKQGMGPPPRDPSRLRGPFPTEARNPDWGELVLFLEPAPEPAPGSGGQ